MSMIVLVLLFAGLAFVAFSGVTPAPSALIMRVLGGACFVVDLILVLVGK